MSGNSNHPVKCSTIAVDPIRSITAIENIKKHLFKTNPMYYALFIIGINTNLRASDLVRITVGQVKNVVPMDEITLKEQKTGKFRRINLNSSCVMAIKHLLTSRHYPSDLSPIFPVQPNYINTLVKSWCAKEKLKGNFGSHTLRKTFGYHQFHTFNVPLPYLMETFNHATQKETMNYLCIQSSEIKNIYSNEL